MPRDDNGYKQEHHLTLHTTIFYLSIFTYIIWGTWSHIFKYSSKPDFYCPYGILLCEYTIVFHCFHNCQLLFQLWFLKIRLQPSSTRCSMTTYAWVGWGGRWEKGFRRDRTYVYLWLIHVDVWQRPTQYCRAIALQ